MRPKSSDLTANARAMQGVTLFFRNRFKEAEDLFYTERNRLPVFALCWATMAYIKAIITFDAAVSPGGGGVCGRGVHGVGIA